MKNMNVGYFFKNRSRSFLLIYTDRTLILDAIENM